MKLIPLTKGLFTKVDDEDFNQLIKHSWYASGRPGKEYAARKMKTYEKEPYKLIHMHEQLTGKPYTDHYDGDSLNNQRYNLKPGTQAQNIQNTPLCRNQSGVGFDSTHNRYKAYININRPEGTKRINVGTYKTRVEAVQARAEKLRELGL